MMDNTFQNKVVWITGASSGIGEALAYQFVKSGSKIILSARRKGELERVKANCELPDEDVMVLPLDLAKHDEMGGKVKEVITRFGRIDVLINNGGISQRSLAKETEFSVYKRLIDIDYLGTVALSLAVLPVFIEQQSGHFAAVTSLMGKFASPLRSGYCGAKHAVHGFFDSVRMEHEEDNILVTLICPGFIRTNISKNALTKDGTKQKTMDDATDKGMSPEGCAARIVAGMREEKREIYVGGKETYAVYLKRLSPSLLDRVVRRSNVT